MARSSRAGGFTFAEAPGRSASAARLLWSAAFDPSVLLAHAGGGSVRDAPAPVTVPWLAVGGGGRLHAVIGGAHHGVRVDIIGHVRTPPLERLIFPFTVTIAPRQLAEFRRLVALARGHPLMARADTRRLNRFVLALRVIDALGEGASLRTVGEAFVRAGDWPGAGESTKSRARRLVSTARALWIDGPRSILAHLSL
ncbi:DUF2285 domain-containing protein [Sphingopyxis sp. GW247-27LB]|uniref:DNA -binding domain-containing protein n=1 Tax=Sphingopyxis sp. GW247-27LB TaxID=2012632 RepID=UPI000BA56775|nr:DUF2285 domain-containing protein [Sphingopyxis sp. GW247-27LB]PAL20626.1 hypothetical protein CD928_15960 [Sphingopyxis sp. GW247-27LB]